MSEGIFDPNVSIDDVLELVSPNKIDCSNNITEVITDASSILDETNVKNDNNYLILFFLVLVVLGYFAYSWSKPTSKHVKFDESEDSIIN